jgi:hypothetical protein
MSRGARISVKWGYEGHSIVLTGSQWAQVKRGEQLTVKGEGYSYEGEHFSDYWAFAGGLDGNLQVTYGDDGGTGFVGP